MDVVLVDGKDDDIFREDVNLKQGQRRISCAYQIEGVILLWIAPSSSIDRLSTSRNQIPAWDRNDC